MDREYGFEILHGAPGCETVVAEGSGADLAAVNREAMHYAFVYGQDGPTRIRWKNMSPADLEALKAVLSTPLRA